MKKETKAVRSKASDSRERKPKRGFKSRRFSERNTDFSENRSKRSYRKNDTENNQEGVEDFQDNKQGARSDNRRFSRSDDKPKRSYREGGRSAARSYKRDDEKPRQRREFDGEDRPRRSYQERDERRKATYRSNNDEEKPRQRREFNGEDRPRRSYRGGEGEERRG